jgi:hypothetical protein
MRPKPRNKKLPFHRPVESFSPGRFFIRRYQTALTADVAVLSAPYGISLIHLVKKSPYLLVLPSTSSSHQTPYNIAGLCRRFPAQCRLWCRKTALFPSALTDKNKSVLSRSFHTGKSAGSGAKRKEYLCPMFIVF